MERWILVHSYVYYQLNENIPTDFDYDMTVNQLFELMADDPEAFHRSRYYHIFENYEPGCTSGFELLEKVKRSDEMLYRHLGIDAYMALDMKRRYVE